MTSQYNGWATAVAAEIAAEKRAANPAPAPDTEKMRLALIRREAARRGAADDTVSSILTSMMVVNADGDLVERDTGKPMDQFLDEMQGTNPAYFAKPAAASAQSTTDTTPNPFVKGPHWSLTGQMIMLKNDPERAEHLQHLASLGRH